MVTGEPPVFEVSCDGCPEGEEVEAESFPELLEWLRENGWENRFRGAGKYDNFCASCVEDGR